MIREILVPLDTSPLAELALPHAEMIALAFGARVHLFSVVDQSRPDFVDSVDWRLRRDEHESYLEHRALPFQSLGIDVTWETSAGPAAEQILEIARSRASDLIIMTTHGLGGLSDFRLSSTVSKVLSNAEASVLVVHPGQMGDGRLTPSYERILAPVDCGLRADWAAFLAAQLAQTQGGEILLVTVVEPPELLGSSQRWSEQTDLAQRLVTLNREVAQRHLGKLAEQLRGGRSKVRTRVVEHEDAAHALTEIADEEDASLVVLSAHGQSSTNDFAFGSVTRHVIEHCSRPVLVFQDNQRVQPRVPPELQQPMWERPRTVT